jgi:phosphopantetheinyl transferase
MEDLRQRGEIDFNNEQRRQQERMHVDRDRERDLANERIKKVEQERYWQS